MKRSAYDDLLLYLAKDERVEAIVLGKWDCRGPKPEGWDDIEGKVLTLGQARPYMSGWRFDHDTVGSAKCPAAHIWTDRRVIFVQEYDGSTRLASVPRHPKSGLLSMHWTS